MINLQELVEKQKQKNFEKKLQELVNKEDEIRWANKLSYVELINKKLQKNLKKNKNKQVKTSIINFLKDIFSMKF